MGRSPYRMAIACLALLGLAWGMIGIQPAWAAGKTVKIIVNGREVESDSAPVTIDERIHVPLRVISENLGAQVEWRPESGHIVINWQTASTPALSKAKAGEFPIMIDGAPLVIPPDYGKAFINSQYRVMVPLRAVGEALDCQVDWDQDRYAVLIQANQPEEVSAEQQMLRDLAAYRTNLKLLDGTYINSVLLMGQDADMYSAEQLQSFQTYLDELSKYPLTVNMPDGSTAQISDLTIMGDSYLKAAQLKEWIKDELKARGIVSPAILELADLYIDIGAQYGVRGDIAFCQSAKETGYWQYTGNVQSWQYNYCGLSALGYPMTGTESLRGADDSRVSFELGVHGAIFASSADGVEAHIQHLYAYATKKDLPAQKTLLDPRYTLVTASSAPKSPRWVDLNSRWAVPGRSYGQSIICDYWVKAVKGQ